MCTKQFSAPIQASLFVSGPSFANNGYMLMPSVFQFKPTSSQAVYFRWMMQNNLKQRQNSSNPLKDAVLPVTVGVDDISFVTLV